jgi:hypothetical protein
MEAGKAQIKGVLESNVASIENEDMELYAQNVAHDPRLNFI